MTEQSTRTELLCVRSIGKSFLASAPGRAFSHDRPQRRGLRHPPGMAGMTRPIALFTGQRADLPFQEVCELGAGWGRGRLEIVGWRVHLDVWLAAEDDPYVKSI